MTVETGTGGKTRRASGKPPREEKSYARSNNRPTANRPKHAAAGGPALLEPSLLRHPSLTRHLERTILLCTNLCASDLCSGMFEVPPMSVTLIEVAKEAGVSVSVASRSLNGRAKAYRISDSTEARVRKAARKLGFRHNQAAKSLRLKKSGLVGVVVPDLSNPFFASIARCITLAAESRGYSVIAADSREETQHEVRLLRQLEDRQVEALVVCPVGTDAGHLRDIHRRGLPLVLADRTFPDDEFLQVTSEHGFGAQKATRLLTQKSHRIIGVLQGLPGTLPNEERLKGHGAALRESGIREDRKLIAGDNFTEASGYHSAKRLLKERPDITAFFAFSIPNAMGAMRACMELGTRVPEDVSLVAFDDSPYADLMSVPLTTVRQDVARLGELAAELVLDSLDENRRKRRRKCVHEVKTHVVFRRSISNPRES